MVGDRPKPCFPKEMVSKPPTFAVKKSPLD
jgi:hypothetical protein